MNVEFYDGVGTTLDMPVMLPPVPSAVDFSRAKKVLIADDVADTGPDSSKLVHYLHTNTRLTMCARAVDLREEAAVRGSSANTSGSGPTRWINFPWSVRSRPSYGGDGQVLDA